MEAGSLIPRRVLFGNPERTNVQISPDGRLLAYVAPLEGVLNVWVAPVERPEEKRPVTRDLSRGVRHFQWAFDNEHILFLKDRDGDENWHIFRVNVASDAVSDLTPLDQIQARIQHISHLFPGELLVAINDSNPEYHQIYRVNIASGERTLVLANDRFADIVTDDEFNVRFAGYFREDGSFLYLEPDGKGGWMDFLQFPREDSQTTEILGFNEGGDRLYMRDSRGRNTSALCVYHIASGRSTMIAEDDRCDVGDVLIDRETKRIQAAAFDYERKHWKVLDEGMTEDFSALAQQAGGDLSIVSRTLDGEKWIVESSVDNGPIRYYLWDRSAKSLRFLFSNRPELEKFSFSSMEPVVITARDGLEMVAYLTVAKGNIPEPQPMVLVVHGGPWGRDHWGFHAIHQWCADRGYAALSVNFRASTGFGKTHINAGDKEWGRKMHDDLVDAVEWAVDAGIADSGRIAIMGGSYGGYATLAGLAFTPELFACGIDIVGPSSLTTLLKSIPPYWAPVLQVFKDKVGDPEKPDEARMLDERSPLNHVDSIKRPLLIAQGANDPRVKQAESDQIVAALKEKGVPVAYLLFPDEGHGFVRPENNLAFYAAAESFLSIHLGGKAQPPGGDFLGSSMMVRCGAENLPGIPATASGA